MGPYNTGMDAQRGFLEAVRESPAEDLHRLAWADWLDDVAPFLTCRSYVFRVDAAGSVEVSGGTQTAVLDTAWKEHAGQCSGRPAWHHSRCLPARLQPKPEPTP